MPALPCESGCDRYAILEGTRAPFSAQKASRLFGNVAILGIPSPWRLPVTVAIKLASFLSKRTVHSVIVTVRDGDTIPIAQHRFVGRTQQEAIDRYRYYASIDPLIRTCVAEGRYGTAPCQVHIMVDEQRIG